MMDAILRLKFEIRSLVAREPALAPLFVPVRWWNQLRVRHRMNPWDHFVGAHTERVIDGMQGSANSFVTAAFEVAQARRMEIHHHLHSPAQILKATRMGLPTLVTIREPVGATLSLVSRWPYVRPEQALREYLRFYGRIQNAADSYVIGLFPACTRDLGSVIRAMNRKFGTDYVPFEHTEKNMRMLRKPAKRRSESEVARRQFKQQISEELEAPRCVPILSRARDLYQKLEGLAPGA
jgi:hypothetical protein